MTSALNLHTLTLDMCVPTHMQTLVHTHRGTCKKKGERKQFSFKKVSHTHTYTYMAHTHGHT